jgi:GAF domain-containing protein/anti-sigma regulatory factor (Ser/Thr protein kinase)
MPVPVDLQIDDRPDAVGQARRVAAAALAGEPAERVSDLMLVVTELLTNAVLHGAAPISLRIDRVDGALRVEVKDAGRAVPVRAGRVADAMTGRGLALVSTLTTSWGTTPTADGGKIVWAELGERTGERTATTGSKSTGFADEWPAPGDGVERFPVRLGAVPTELLLAAKAHIDNVVREFTLMRSGYATDGLSLPAHLRELVVTVTEDFAEARTEIKRQALSAADRGDAFTDLVLHLPPSAADAGERYLAALDEVDYYARAAQLLTLAPPRSHREFRHWYVQALVDQLRGAARGVSVDPPPPFAQLLASEVDRLSTLEDSWDRLRLLQRLTADLTDAHTIETIAQSVVDNAREYRGVQSVRVYVITDTATLRCLAKFGFAEELDRYLEFPADSDLPGAVVARTGEPLFVRSLGQLARRLPDVTLRHPNERSLHVVPLTVGGHTLGVLSLTFVAGEVADVAQLEFVQAIADALAQALERAQATARMEYERGRELQLLSAQLDVLTGAVAGEALDGALSRLLLAVERASSDGMIASILLLDADGQHLRHCAAPSLPSFYNEAIDGIEIGPSVGSCGTAAYLREQVIVEDIRTDPRWAAYRELAERAKVRACWSTPIVGRDHTLLGTFAMYYPHPQRPTSADLVLTDVLVRTVALVVERSRVDEQRERELATERAAALTLQHSLLPSVPASIGPVRLEARYRAGDPGVEVGGDWFDAIAVADAVVLVVGDVQGHDLRAAALMGELRTITRAHAAEGQQPADILARAHRHLSSLDTELIATAVVVRIATDSHVATVASAGHLPPAVLCQGADGWQSSDLAGAIGPPLGVGEGWPQTDVPLPPDAMLLLYTDGLVESRAWPIDRGLELLHAALRGLPDDAGLGDVLDAAIDLVPAGSRGDDVAVLAART